MLEEGRLDGGIEGRLNEARRLAFRQGTKRFGAPDAATVAVLEAIQDIDRLEALADRIQSPEIDDWEGLLDTP
jgi:hypothetical protein